MSSNIVHTQKQGNFALNILYDEYAECPIDYLDFGTLYLFHKKYNIGHEHGFDSPSEFFEHFDSTKSTMDDEPVLFLPVYMYDHSKITLSTTPFSCQLDSEQVGVIVVPVSKARREFGDDYLDKALRTLVNDVQEYSHYLSGDCYGFIVSDEHENVTDSCFGILGYSNACKQGEEALRHVQ